MRGKQIPPHLWAGHCLRTDPRKHPFKRGYSVPGGLFQCHSPDKARSLLLANEQENSQESQGLWEQETKFFKVYINVQKVWVFSLLPSLCLSIYPHSHSSMYPPTHPFIHPTTQTLSILIIHSSIYPHVCLASHPFIYLSIHSTIHPSVHSSIHPSTHLPIHTPITC